MAEKEFTTDPVALLERARAEINAVRRTIQGLYDQFVQTNSSAKEMARNELYKALVERLQLAEREAAELTELVVLARDTSGS
jgi:cell shape-determining protein MreC